MNMLDQGRTPGGQYANRWCHFMSLSMKQAVHRDSPWAAWEWLGHGFHALKKSLIPFLNEPSCSIGPEVGGCTMTAQSSPSLVPPCPCCRLGFQMDFCGDHWLEWLVYSNNTCLWMFRLVESLSEWVMWLTFWVIAVIYVSTEWIFAWKFFEVLV